MELPGVEAPPADGHEPGSQLILRNGIGRCPGDQYCYLRIGQHSAVALLANQIYHVHAAGSPVAIRAKSEVLRPCGPAGNSRLVAWRLDKKPWRFHLKGDAGGGRTRISCGTGWR